MNALVINCSPVRTGATAEIVKLVSDQLSVKYSVKSICIDDYAIALRTGPNMPECERIISSIEHFYGHLEIERVGHLGLTSIEYKEDVEPRRQEIIDFCSKI